MSNKSRSRRRKRRKLERQQRAEEAQAKQSAGNAENTAFPSFAHDENVGPGFYGPNARSDARMASHILSLGVIPEEEAAELYKMAAESARTLGSAGNYRGLTACITVMQRGAKLELDAFALAAKTAGGPLAPMIPHRDSPESGAFLEAASHDDLKATAQILADLGIVGSNPAENITPASKRNVME